METAKRELLEETGYVGSEWVCLGRFVVDGNRQCGTAHLFLAKSASRVAVPATDETELMSPRRLVEAIRSGEIGLLGSVGALSLAMAIGLE